ncbi:conserved hypothetical protein [Gloeothece citriformis PCC 7424]|uniref:Isochorismate synthase n=1 Tax=Gloeothece citriformis (strain PCC 7424) TaxID=65393 RepID=B7KA92_GLOC7|nr:hypothetical protein [Gloeothece citriformis]ACK72866.1 conserved hypothetical protein [Gloeothece citriformis PCC 7424]
MNIFEKLQHFFQKFSNGVARVFSPNDDDYPEIGVEPFEEDPNADNFNQS